MGLKGLPCEGHLSADVCDQERMMWKVGETVEGRLDACVAAVGVLKTHTDCLE